MQKAEALRKKEKQKCTPRILPVYGLNYDPYEKTDPIMTKVVSIDGREMEYYDESVPTTPLSLEAVKRTSNLRKKFEPEAELRIELNTTSLLDLQQENLEPGLHHLIQYIKLKCPSIRNYCKQVYKRTPDKI